MNTTATINSSSMSNRIAAGVTAEYVRDLTRRPASAPSDVRRGSIRRHRAATARLGRDRDDCGQRSAGRVMAL